MLSYAAALLTGRTDQHIESINERHGMHKAALPAFLKLQQKAKLDGFDLSLVSSFRSFDRQLAIWNRKYTGKATVLDINEQPVNLYDLSELDKIQAIMLFSALPGASRHHWGTDIDVYAPNLLPQGQSFQLEVWEYQEGGPMHPLSIWLNENAKSCGFFRPYDCFRGGVSEEPWHLSFAPVANDLQAALSEEIIEEAIETATIEGKDAIIANLSHLFSTFITNVGAFPNE